MSYLLAIVLPPLGMMAAGKTKLAIICVVLMITMIGWPVASIWAVLTVMEAKADKRADRIARSGR